MLFGLAFFFFFWVHFACVLIDNLNRIDVIVVSVFLAGSPCS